MIGYPLGHSYSADFFNEMFKSEGIDATYSNYEMKSLDGLRDLVASEGLSGFNVTIPHKVNILEQLDYLDPHADIIGAVNTVVVEDYDGYKALHGYNTDYVAFGRSIMPLMQAQHVSALILGTGGAAHAASVALADSNVKEIRFYTRSIPNSLELLTYMRKVFPKIKFDAYQIEYIRDLSMVDILVNTTPIGMLGRSADMTPVEKPQLMTLPQGALVYDVIYNPKNTVLLKLAQELGYKTVNGVDMFIGQAAAAEEIWTGRKPNTDLMKIALLEVL